MQVILLRHGQTSGNEKSRYIGRTDEPLSESGAAAVARRNGDAALERVYVSPLLRARQTTAILFPKADQTVVPDLREMDFGDFEGRSADDMRDDAAYRAWVDGNCLGPCPNGEDIGAFSDRVCAAFARTVADAAARQEERAVFVVHGGTIMALLSRFAEPSAPFYRWYVQNGCGYAAEALFLPAGLFRLKDVTPIEGMPL